MQENRPKEILREPDLQVPRVSLETILNLDNRLFFDRDQMLVEGVRIIQREDPALLLFLDFMGKQMFRKDSKDVLRGGVFVYRTLTADGSLMPPIEPADLEDLMADFAKLSKSSTELSGINLKKKSNQELESYAKQVHSYLQDAKSDALHPLAYADENPHLMVYLAARGIDPSAEIRPNAFGFGGMFVYKLKRSACLRMTSR